MTTTVKLPEALEKALRQRSALEGRSISEVMRDALAAYLAQPAVRDSAWSLGQGLLGRYSGPADLASERKTRVTEVWEGKHGRRR